MNVFFFYLFLFFNMVINLNNKSKGVEINKNISNFPLATSISMGQQRRGN